MNRLNLKYIFRAKVLVFFVSLFIFRKTFLIRIRDSGSFTSLDFYNLFQIAVVVILFILLLFNGKLFPKIKTQSLNYFILLFIFGIFSGLWSTNLFYSSYIAFEVLIMLLTATALISYVSFDFEFAEKFFLNTLVLIGIIAFFGLVFRRSEISFASLHNNGYPITGAILAAYSFAAQYEPDYYNKRKKLMSRYLFFGIFLLLLGSSLGSFLSFIVSVFITLILTTRSSKKNIFYLIIIPLLIIFSVSSQFFIDNFILVNKNIEQLDSLNGRTYLWQIFIEMIYEKPFFGWGYDVISRVSSKVYATNTHFFLISILGGMGITGLLIFFAAFINLLKELIAYLKNKLPGHLAFIAGLSAAFVNGGSKGYIGEGVYPETISFFLILVFFSYCFKFYSLNEKYKK